MLSVIIPTYNERENIELLLNEIFELFDDIEVIVVDDNSKDGTAEIVQNLQRLFSSLKLVQRPRKNGISSAVLAGFFVARGDVVAAMDADFSHPPKVLVEMYEKIDEADFVVGSRYISGGGINKWPWYRKIVSLGATSVARILTPIKDPVSGFFMIRKKCLQGRLNKRGMKICLELLVKAKYDKVVEIPYTFTDRRGGKSKLSLPDYFQYLQNVASYLWYKIK